MARELAIVVTAETSQAEQALGRVESSVQGVEKAATDSTGAVKEHGKALDETANKASLASETFQALLQRVGGPAGIVGGFVAATKAAMSFADSYSDLANKTGIAVEALQRWDFLAKTNDVSMNQMIRAAQRLGADLAQGDKSVVAGVTKLGLSVQDLLAMNPEQRFETVAKAIGSIEDPAQRAAAAEDIMKRAGLELTGVLKELAEGSDQWAPQMSSAWIETGAMMEGVFETIVAHAQNVIYYIGLAIPKAMRDGLQAWHTVLQGLGVMEGPELPSIRGDRPSMASFAGPNVPQPGTPEFAALERELTQGARNRAGGGGGGRGRTTRTPDNPFINDWMGGFLERVDANQWAVGARGMNGTIGAPGWRPNWMPMPQLLLPATQNMNFAPFAPTVGMNRPNVSGGGGGGFFSNLFGNVGGGLRDMWQGMSGGQGIGGFMANTGLGFLTGGLSSLLGMGIGAIGKGIGKLFGFGGNKDKKETEAARGNFIDQFGGIDALKEKAAAAGFSLDKLFNAKKVKDFNSEVEKLGRALDEQERDAQRLQSAMQKYGLTIGQAGQQFKQAEMNKGFKELGEDFRVLLGAGFQFNDIAQRMAPAFGELIHSSIEMGTQVPRELEPIIRKMIEMGVLVDKNGDKFTDIAQIPFAESMTQGFDRVVAALDRVLVQLGGVVGGFDAAAGAAANLGAVAGGINIPTPGGAGSGDATDGGGDAGAVTVSRGGIIQGPGNVLYFKRGGFVTKGFDSVPAMLSPGEMVIARDNVDAAVASMKAGAAAVKGAVNTSMPVGQRVEQSNQVIVVPMAVEKEIDTHRLVAHIEAKMMRRIPNGASKLRGTLDQLYARRRKAG